MRRACKVLAVAKGAEYHWQLDDNITRFIYRVDRLIRSRDVGAIFRCVEDFVCAHDGIAIAALAFLVFSNTKKTDLGWNQGCYCSVFVRNAGAYTWRDVLNGVEDADYSLQVLSSGECTLVFNRLIQGKIPTERVRGGMTEFYRAGGRERSYRVLAEAWRVPLRTMKDGRLNFVWNGVWSRFRQRPRSRV